MKNCVNLYLKTEYSLLSSLIKISTINDLCSYSGYDSLAIADDNMYGAYKFYKECVKNGIKPIIGLHLNFVTKNFNSSILLYAKTNEGYNNLMRISTLKNTSQKEFTFDDFIEYTYDLIAVIPSFENEIVNTLYNGNFSSSSIDCAKKILDRYKLHFKDLYFGIDLQTSISRSSSNRLLEFASLNQLKPVAINKSAYSSINDLEAYRILRAIDTNNKSYVLSEEESNMAFLSKVDMELLFSKYSFLLDNTLEISEKCNVIINNNGYHFPKYDIENSTLYLLELCKAGLNKRLSQKKDKNELFDINQYKERLLYEYEVINKMGFVDYFLIVYDYVKYAKTNNICVGPGRGSAGGSLVSYSLGITDVDPIKYDLLFERFLNPERISMPDIDVDFPDDKRDEVIKYIGKKYGINRVAHITTFGTFKARLAIRDVSRFIDIEEFKVKEVLKCIDSKSLLSSIDSNEYLQKLINQDNDINYLVSLALKIEGLPRNCSTHAAGIIMADKSLTDYTPLQQGLNGIYQTQYEASDLEDLGLVKMDVLGLRNLSIIKNVLDDIKNKENINISINQIQLDDRKVLKNISKGNTLGIFQLESQGVKKLLIDLKASSINDIINATSLYRPGPKDMIPVFVKRKNNEKFEYIHKDLEEILKDTYGIIVFQEQIMLIAKKIAKYSLGQADILRRAISKKKKELIQEERNKFINSSVNNGYTLEVAEKIYDYIEKFANYGFNKSHAVSYSIIAYQMAYLKTYYFKSFMTNLMSNNIGDISSLSLYISECMKEKVMVHSPNINYSNKLFTYVNDAIYYPLLGINNLGDVVVNNLINERNNNGLFLSFEDFVKRTKDIVNKRQFINLVHSCSLDCFGLSHKGMIESYDFLLQKIAYEQTIGTSIIKTNISTDEYSFEEISLYEKEALGFSFKYNQFAKYRNIFLKYNCNYLADLVIGKYGISIVIITRYREILTKNNEKMAFISIKDETFEIDGVIFPSVMKTIKSSIVENEAYIIKYKVEQRNEQFQAIIDSIYIL